MQGKTIEAGPAMRTRAVTAVLFCLLLGGVTLGAGSAAAFREAVEQVSSPEQTLAWLVTDDAKELPEGACGLAVEPLSGDLYVSDFYHRRIDVFGPSGKPVGAIGLAPGDPGSENDDLDAACGLAFDSGGRLYANELHEKVMLLPGEQVIDSSHPTGVAVDGADNVYVDARTYVALYQAPVTPGEAPVAKIGLGSLGDGYGVAVDSAGKRVYVPDAATDSVKVYEPALDLVNPVEAIEMPQPGLDRADSLVDAAVAVDRSSGEGQGHLLVAEDLEPGAEDPEAAVYEFDADGDFLGRLQSPKYTAYEEVHTHMVFGEPSGLVVDPDSGELFVTTGNSERSNVLKYGPYQAFAPPPPGEPLGLAGVGSLGKAGAAGAPAAPSPPLRRGASASVVVQRGPVRVSFDGKLTPRSLPRHGRAPVGIAVDARIVGTGDGSPPQLRKIAIAINRNGRFNSRGLPVCSERQIQPSTSAGARAACGGALVGEGHFAANVKLPEQSPFPSSGKVLAFNGRLHGNPAILAHIYGTQPAPTSYVLPFSIKEASGTYGTVLEALLPQATGDWGYVTGLKMTLRRSFRYHGRRDSYLSAGCPAPSGFPAEVFPLARTSFAFAGGTTLVSVLNRSCKAKG
jgi:DNA-binding beta-propeller fold protein YncE